MENQCSSNKENVESSWRVKEALSKSEARLNAIVHSTPLPMFTIDADHKVIFWSKSLEDFSGIKAKDVEGTNRHWKVFYEKEQPCLADLLVDGNIENTPTWHEGKYARSKIQESSYEETAYFPTLGKWLVFIASPIKDSEGNIIGAVETLNDATERKHSEEEIKKSHAILDRAQSIVHVGNWALDVKSNSFQWSDEVFRIFGYKPKEFQPTVGWLMFHVHPSDKKMISDSLSESIRGDKMINCDCRLIMPDGTTRYAHVIGDRIKKDAAGNPQWLYGIIQDVTERKHTEEEFKKNASILARAQQIAHIGNWAWDLKKNNFTWSDEVYRIFGQKPGDFQPTADWLKAHIHPADLELFQQSIDVAFRENKLFYIDFRIVLPDGSVRYVNWIADKCKRDPEGHPMRLYGIIQNVTERKQAEEEFKKNASILGRAQQIAHIGNWAWDLKKNNFTWSDEVYRIFGQKPGDFQPTADWLKAHIHSSDLELFQRSVDTAFRENKLFSIDFRVVMPDGSVRYVNWIADKCKRDPEGHPMRLYGVIQNISERKQAEEEFKKNASILARAQQIAHIGNWSWNLKNNHFIWSDEVYRIFGQKPGDFQPTADWLASHIHPKDQALFHDSVDRAFRENKLFYIDFRVVLPDGSVRYVNWIADKCKRDPEGHPMRLYGVVQDITDRKLTEEEFKKSSSILARAQQISHVGNWSWNLKNNNFIWSDEVYRIFGHNPKEFTPTFEWLLQHAHEDDKVVISKMMDSALRENKLFRFDYRIVMPDSSIKYVHCMADRCVRDPEGHPMRLYGIIQDINERKMAELALRKAHDELEMKVIERTADLAKTNGALQEEINERTRIEQDLDKERVELKRSNEELEQFAYIASHDLQEPLRMVNQYVQLLGKRYKGKLDPSADEYIKFAADGTARMRQMIVDLLEFSRVGTRAKPLEPTDMEDVFKQVETNLSVAIQECNATVTHTPMPVVMSDYTQIMHVMQNLVSNALKFRRDGVAPVIHVGAEKKSDEWIFSVADNGIGIDPKYFDKLFVIFQRLNSQEKYKGNGIGLAICRKIVERHGGRIWVESTPGQGTTFLFTIPASMEPQANDGSSLKQEA